MSNKTKTSYWGLFAALSFFIFVLLQLPASWLIAKFYKNNQTLFNVSGNIWAGQADWQSGQLKGTLDWKTRPLDLFLLRAAADVNIQGANSKIAGTVGYGFGGTVMIRQMTGHISSETLHQLRNWTWPEGAIRVNQLGFNYKKQDGFSKADGGVQWAGGELHYNASRMQVPAMVGKFSDQNQKLLLDLKDTNDHKLLNLQLDPSMMLDVQVTQRMLMNVSGYEGQAGLDTFVVSTRQPLGQGGL